MFVLLVQVLRPEASIQKMELWRAMFQAPCLTPSSALSSAHTPITTTTTSVSSSAPSTSTQVYSSTVWWGRVCVFTIVKLHSGVMYILCVIIEVISLCVNYAGRG